MRSEYMLLLIVKHVIAKTYTPTVLLRTFQEEFIQRQ